MQFSTKSLIYAPNMKFFILLYKWEWLKIKLVLVALRIFTWVNNNFNTYKLIIYSFQRKNKDGK